MWCYILSDYCNYCLNFQCPMKPISNLMATKTSLMCNSVFTKTFLLERKKWKSSMWSNNATYHLHKQTTKNYIWNIWSMKIRWKCNVQILENLRISLHIKEVFLFQYNFTISNSYIILTKVLLYIVVLYSLLYIVQSFSDLQGDERKTI